MKLKNETMMERYGITCQQKSTYHYKQFQYNNLCDAIAFARREEINAIMGLTANSENKS